MKPALVAIGIAIVAVAAGLVAASGAWLFWDAWKSSDLEAFRALVGGFAGAFFAYLFVRMGDALKKLYDRKETNHTALVKLQHYFNDCLNATSDNLFIINDCASVFSEERLGTNQAPLYMNAFHTYVIDRETVTKLTNLDFLNEVYSLNVSLNKTNHSLGTIDRAYILFRDALIAKNIDIPIYQANARRYRDRCLEMRGFLMQLQGDLIRLYAITNLLLKGDRPFFLVVLQRLVRTAYPKNFQALLAVEHPRVKAEMEALAKASADRNREAQQK